MEKEDQKLEYWGGEKHRKSCSILSDKQGKSSGLVLFQRV